MHIFETIIDIIIKVFAFLFIVVAILTLWQKRNRKRFEKAQKKEAAYIEKNKDKLLKSGKKAFKFPAGNGTSRTIYARDYKEANFLHKKEIDALKPILKIKK